MRQQSLFIVTNCQFNHIEDKKRLNHHKFIPRSTNFAQSHFFLTNKKQPENPNLKNHISNLLRRRRKILRA